MNTGIFKQVYSVGNEKILISKIGDNLLARIDYSIRYQIGLMCLCPVISNLDTTKYVIMYPKHWFSFNPHCKNLSPIATKSNSGESLESVEQYYSKAIKSGKYTINKDDKVITTIFTDGNAYLEFKEYVDEPKISVFVKYEQYMMLSFENDSTPIKQYGFCYKLKGTPSSSSAALLLRPLEPWENGGGV